MNGGQNTCCQQCKDPDGLTVVAEYDYSDAPEWALPREWIIYEQYQLEHQEI